VIVGEAVHEQHIEALALDEDVELNVIEPHQAAVDCHETPQTIVICGL